MPTPRVRVIDLETGGNGPNDVCEIGWQDVVLGDDGRWSVNEERGALMVNPGRPISPDTMAVHHILDRHVADSPFWKDLASSVLRPSGHIDALAAHRAAFEQRYCTPRFYRWRTMDMHMEMRAARMARSSKIFQSDASIPAHAGRHGA